MKKFLLILTLLAFAQCTTNTNVKLLPAKDAATIETLWKNKTVGKGADFSLTVSNFIFEDRNLVFLKDGKPISKVEMQITPSVPLLFVGWIGLGIPYLWIASVPEQQTIDLSNELKRTETNP